MKVNASALISSVLQQKSAAVDGAVQHSSAPLKPPSDQASQLVSQISQNTKISPAQKRILIDSAAIVDQFINNPSSRKKFLSSIAGIGIFLGQKSSIDYPKFETITGLRFYEKASLKVAGQMPAPTQPQLEQGVEASLEKVVQEAAGVKVEQALAQKSVKPSSSQQSSENDSQGQNASSQRITFA